MSLSIIRCLTGSARRRLRRSVSCWTSRSSSWVGAGNHYVDLFAGEDGQVWVGVHFGSRGFGHRTASGFLALAAGKQFDEHAPAQGLAMRRS